MNPLDMMKIAKRMKIFGEQHPKTAAFLRSVPRTAVREGAVIELAITTPENAEYVTNFRVTSDDMETLGILMNMKQDAQ